MLDDASAEYLASRTYREDAKREINILPLGGIYWEDEYPFCGAEVVPETVVSEGNYSQILRMFALRVQLWKGKQFSEENREFWDAVQAKAPTWALFHRLVITDDDMKAQDFGTQLADEFEASIWKDADEILVEDDNGTRHVSATFDLTKDEPVDEKTEEDPNGESSIQ
jgi:hypothetical protein